MSTEDLDGELLLPGMERSPAEVAELLAKPATDGALAARFGIPPFSVLDARAGYWQARKRVWRALGIQSEIGRGDNLLKLSDTVLEPDPEKRAALQAAAAEAAKQAGKGYAANPYLEAGDQRALAPRGNGTSIFDPVICELSYRWFCPPGGAILDPFAGGSVRGIVAGKLGREYCGIDLSARQIAANEDQRAALLAPDEQARVRWVCGDSRECGELAPGRYDMVMSCPPYAFLERYSDDPRDLSTLEYEEFAPAYAEIIRAAAAMLRPDRFAIFVVGDVRERKNGGAYCGLPLDTIAAFQSAGLRLYNWGILITSVGSLSIRVGPQFTKSRKFGNAHQFVLVFVKGDPFAAAKACGTIELDMATDEVAALPAPGTPPDVAGPPAAAVDAPEEPATAEELDSLAAQTAPPPVPAMSPCEPVFRLTFADED